MSVLERKSRRLEWIVATLLLLTGAGWLAASGAGQPAEKQRRIEELEQQRLRLEREAEELDRRIEEARRGALEIELEDTGESGAEDNLEETTQRSQVVTSEEVPSGEATGAEREARRRQRTRSDQKYAFGSTIKVQDGDSASDLLAIGGGIKVDGEVLGDAVAVGGSIKIDGRVTGDVISVGNNVELGPEAEVLGSAVSVGGRVIQEDGATVVGRVSEVALGGNLDFGDWWWVNRGIDWSDRGANSWRGWTDLAWSMMGMFLLVVLTGLVALVARDPVDRVSRLAFAEPFKALLVGLAVELLFLPGLAVLAVLLAISIIGIPLLLLLPFLVLLLVAAALVGFTSMALGLGRMIKHRLGLGLGGGLGYLIVGLVAIQGLSLTEQFLDAVGLPFFIYALFGLFGFLVKYLAWTTGLGAVVLSRIGSRSSYVPPPPLAGAGVPTTVGQASV